MSEANRGVIQLTFRDGSEMHSWESFQLRDSYTDPLGSFSFTVRPTRVELAEVSRLLVKGSLVGIKINGNPQATCLIQTVTRTISKSTGVTFAVEAKSVLVTAFEGHVDPDISQEFKSDTPIASVVSLALEPFGFEFLFTNTADNVAALTGRPLDGRKPEVQIQELKHKEAKANEGETAYGFASRIFTRLGLALRTDVAGNLLLGSPDFDQAPAYELEQSSSLTPRGDPFVGDVQITETNDGVFSEYVFRGVAKDAKGQKRATRPVHRLRVEGIPDPPVEAPFSDARTTTVPVGRHSYKSDSGAVFKPFYRLDKFARDLTQCETMCNRAHGRKSERSFTVEGEVDGLISTTGRVWSVDTTARVRIDQADIDETMWITEVTKTADRRGGQKTRLKLIPLNSLILGP
jgi:prophage tail gpP-like protein